MTIKIGNIKLSNSKWIYVILILVYKIALDIVFCRYISPIYSYYMNLKYIFNMEKVIYSYCMLFIVLFFTYYEINNLTSITLSVELVIMYIPMLTLYSYSDRNTKYMITVTLCYCMQSIIAKCYYLHEREILEIKPAWAKTFYKILIFFLLITAFMYTFIKYGYPSLAAFNLVDVYSIRSGISYTFPFNYIVPWVFKIVCIFICITGLYHKKWAMVLISISMQLFFFLIYANKSTLFSLILVLGIYWGIKKWNIINAMPIGLILLAVVSTVMYKQFGVYSFLSYGIRRTLFVPATIKFAYYDYFSQNELLHFADNTIGHLLNIQSPYELEAPKIIAEYLGVPNSHCNTGYWGDAYANFGIFGVVIFSIIVIWLLICIEKLTKRISQQIVIPIVTVMVYNLNDSALFTWILGGGGALMIFMFWLYRYCDKGMRDDKEI